MKYVPPYGRETEGDSAQYINGDPSVGRQGSIPPANAFEHPMREIVHVIEKNQIVPSEADLYQLIKAVRSQRANYVEDTGSANNLSVALDPPLAAYTVGLVLRVRIKVTNTGASRINAGAGNVPIRKMNGADVGNGDLPAGAVATMVYDGSVFQLSNFGGSGGTGTGDVFEVKIPYCVDTSTTPGIVTANFSPAITALAAGDEIAVKINNTAPGPTIININSLPAIHLQPNGGGEMLQGDMHAGNVVIFFYDGTYLYFQPDPQIDAAVQFMVGPGQHFPDIATGVNTIKRKTIGANGLVTFKMVAGIFNGSISVNHPSADRIVVQGTMIGPNPTGTDFQVTGNDATHRSNDGVYNLSMLRSRYGTEIQVLAPGFDYGIANVGPGRPTFKDLLITSNRPTPGPPGSLPGSIGVWCQPDYSIYCNNVSVWGCEVGSWADGVVSYDYLFLCAASGPGVHSGGGEFAGNFGGIFGNDMIGMNTAFGRLYHAYGRVMGNGMYGIRPYDGGNVYLPFSTVLNNENFDLFAYAGATIFATGTTFGTCSPPVNTMGNYAAIVVSQPPP